MFAFYVTPWWIKDDKKQLTGAGVQWAEPDLIFSEPIENIHPWLRVAVPVALFLASFKPAEEMQLYAIAGGLFAAWVLLPYVGHFICNLNRDLYFHCNGKIEMPSGQPGWFKGTIVKGRTHDVMGIEMHLAEDQQKDKPKKFDVYLYFTDGRIVLISRNLRSEEAHELTVKLNTALRDVRAAMSRQPRQGVKPQHSAGKLAMID